MRNKFDRHLDVFVIIISPAFLQKVEDDATVRTTRPRMRVTRVARIPVPPKEAPR